jgi:GNAT superfamily N-acetyltransferase
MGAPRPLSLTLRPGRDDDAEAYIRLIGDAWAEFPGVIFDVDGELPELRALASHFAALGGMLWLAEDGSGMVATRPLREDQAWEIGRMYVAKSARGTGLAQHLLATAEAHARAQGAARMVLWTDTRFEAAHAFYEKAGYVRQGAIRILDDLSKSLEFRYTKPSQGLVVEAMDAGAAASAERRLSEILIACVAEGASVSYLPPMNREKARAHWKRVSTEVAQGQRLLLVAWWEGVLAGTIQLGLESQENQPHRAEVEKLLVDPAWRRRGIGTALVQRAEQAAQRIGRRLLTLDTRGGDAGEALYRRLGWIETGRVPDCELDGARQLRDVVYFWKALG